MTNGPCQILEEGIIARNNRPFALFISMILLIVVTTARSSHAQETKGTLRGFVTDSTTVESLSFANAYIKELQIGATTDSHGYFLITGIPSNKNYTLVVSYIGYQTKNVTIRLAPDKVTQYNVVLVPTNIQLQTIENVSQRIVEKNETNISLQRIAIRDIEALPKGVEADVFRSLKYLPGVQSTGDVSARYYVRGGASNQNLVLIDGITIYSPFHALGLFGIVDPDIINSVEFYEGGFPAEFGDRLSSVLKIDTKDGNKNNLSAKASGSLIAGKVLLEGPIPNGSFMLAGRKSYSNSIIKKFLNEQQTPIDFYDFSFKANYSDPDFLPGSKFSVNGLFSSDNLNNKDPRIEDYNWKNNILGFKWFQVGSSPVFLELGLSVSDFSGGINPKSSLVSAMNNSVQDIGVQMNVNYMFDNKDELSVGYHINHVNTHLYMQNSYNAVNDLGSSGVNISLYVKYKLLQWEYLGFDVGTRINLTTLSASKQIQPLEPRVNLVWHLASNISLKAAFGLYQQTMTTVSDENEVINIFEPWIIIPDYLAPAQSKHYILGLETEPINNIVFNIEGYYKKVENFPMLNEQKTFITDHDLVSGGAESYGLDFYLKFTQNPLVFTASYSYAFAYKELNGLRYYPRYDLRHKLNLALEVQLGKGWSSNVEWIFTSGLPFTQMVGYYDKYYFQNVFIPWDKFDPRIPYLILGVQNLGRLPNYHRLDITLSKKFRIDPFTLDLDLSIINVYDRKNIFYFRRDTGERVNMLPFLPSATITIGI